MTVGYKVVRDTWYYDWRRLVKTAPELNQYMNSPAQIDNHGDEYINPFPYGEHRPPTTTYNSGLGDEEMEIVKLVSQKDVSASEPTRDYRYQLQKYNPCTNYQLRKNIEETNRFAGIACPSVPLLPFPRKFLGAHSVKWSGENTVYTFLHTIGESDVVRTLSKEAVSENDKMLRILHTSYTLNRNKDFMSEDKARRVFLTFNKETNKLYLITYRKTLVKNKTNKLRRNKWVRKISSINPITDSLGAIENNTIGKKFLTALIDDTLCKMPGVHFPTRYKSKFNQTLYRFEQSVLGPKHYIIAIVRALILQRKIGRPAEWAANNDATSLIDEALSNTSMYNSLELEAINNSVNVKRCRRKYRYNVYKNLAKKPTLKHFFESLFGHYGSKSIIKYLMISVSHPYREGGGARAILDTAIYLSGMLNKNLLGKEAVHFIRQLVDQLAISDDIHETTGIHDLLWTMSGIAQTDFTMQDDADRLLLRPVIHSFIKTLKRLWGEGASLNGIRWTTWRDMFRMANQLGIRIRPNKFTSVTAIQNLHNDLAQIAVRDTSEKEQYGDLFFMPFKSPDKEFGGFKFIQLTHVDDLVAEGTSMHHCVGGYGQYCLSGYSIIFSMWKDRSYVTIELSGSTLDIRQQYTLKDNVVSNPEILKAIDDWHTEVLKLHANDKETYQETAKKFTAYQKLVSHQGTHFQPDVQALLADLNKEFESVEMGRSGIYGHDTVQKPISPAIQVPVIRDAQLMDTTQLLRAELERLEEEFNGVVRHATA